MHCADCNVALPPDARFCAACGQALAGSTGPSPQSRGLVIALVVACGGAVVVLLVAIVAAIAIPNLLNAIDRGKQKRSMADLRSIGTAIEEYSITHDVYPEAGDIQALRAVLEPEYLDAVPIQDGWGNDFGVGSSPEGYALVSAGKDGVFDDCHQGTTTDFDDDICFANGVFVQWPEGQQN